MGYSCTALAQFTMDSIQEHFVPARRPYDGRPSNGLPGGGFWEIGRENADGAITGTLFRHRPSDPLGTVRRYGSFRISPEGNINRFPGLTSSEKRAIEEKAALRYVTTFQQPLPDQNRSKARPMFELL